MKNLINKYGLGEPALAILLLLFLAAAIFSFSSCTTQSKVQKWNEANQEAASRYCADHWPLHIGDTIINVTIDSSEYTESMAGLYQLVFELNELNDSLRDAVRNGDTACRRYIEALERQKRIAGQVKTSARDFKPVYVDSSKTIPKSDSALTTTLRLENTRLKSEATTCSSDVTRLKSDKKVYTWMLIAAGLLIILLLFLLFKKKSNPILSKL